MAELMTFFCEQAAGLVRDVGLQDESYFDARERVEKIERLGRVRAACRDVGYGVFDEMTMLLEESGLGSER